MRFRTYSATRLSALGVCAILPPFSSQIGSEPQTIPEGGFTEVALLTPDTIPVDVLDSGAEIWFSVLNGEDLPVTDVWLILPETVQLELGSTAIYGRPRFVRALSDQSPQEVHWFEREEIGRRVMYLDPGKEDSYGALFRRPGAVPGQVLYFGVRVMLSDSSTIEYTGPPGSERPALRVETVAPTYNRFVVPAAIILALLCLGVLVVAGGWKVRLFLRKRGSARM